MTFGSLCTGIGGLDLGFEWAGLQCCWQCEKVPEFRHHLARKFGLPCYEDIGEVDETAESVDVIAGGIPCQPHSDAGLKLGEFDERNLWPDTARIIRAIRPLGVVVENVAGILTTIAGQIIDELEREGYEVRPLVFRAKDIGSPQNRKRVWFLGRLVHADGKRLERAKRSWVQRKKKAEGWNDNEPARSMLLRDWPARPSQKHLVPVATDGLSRRLAGRRWKLTGLGNAVCPLCGWLIGRAITDMILA